MFHLQANADVRHGLEHPRKDLEQNTIATANVLEAMRAAGVSKIAFSSTGSVYGEPEVFPTPEDAPFPRQTSLYAASKLAGEGMIGAYAHGFGFTGLVFRFVSILGERYTHGHVYDFYCALKRDPTRLRVLGDGRQEKSYLYVKDCVEAIMTAVAEHDERPGELGVYNLGTDETVVVDDSIGVICRHMGVEPELDHAGGKRGWPGDSPLIVLDCARIRSLGWRPTLTIEEAIGRTLEWFDANPYAWEREVTSGGGGPMSVIFSRAPLRISLGGGGTDLPSYYREHGGFLVAGAIDKYIYMLMHTVFQRRYKMKYSETEDVDDIAAIRHPILRESLQRHWRGNPLEVASVADVPAGTGMGSSGAFTVALLKGLAHARRTSITQGALAEAACEIEIDLLKEPCGKQDPYVAAHGGICAYTFEPDGSVTVEPLELAPETLRGLREQLLLFYTGEARSASAVLSDQNERTKTGDAEMLENLHRTKEMGRQSRDLLVEGDLFAYAELMHEHWLNKRRRSPGMANDRIDDLYTLARRSGVVGGKLVGAGGGGFLLALRAQPGGHASGDGRGGSERAPVRLRVRRGLFDRVHMSAPGLRVAIVGCGLIGDKRAAALRPEDEVVGATDPVAERAEALVKRYGGRACPRNRRAARPRTRRGDRRDHP